MEFKIASALLRYLAFLIAITMYQAGIAIMAQKKGDKSASTQQKATLNPLPHIDLIGTVIFPLITIFANSPIILGWPKMHIIDMRYFKKLRSDLNYVYLSGILTNFCIALICMLSLRILGGGYFIFNAALNLADINILIKIMLSLIGLTNIIIGALFLLPIPGTAGWNILLNNISYPLRIKLQKKELIISLIALLTIILGVFSFYFNIFIYLFISLSNTSVGFL